MTAVRRLALLLLVALSVSGALLSTGGRVAGCESACVAAADAPVRPYDDRCQLTAECGGALALTITTIAALAVAGPRLAAPRPHAAPGYRPVASLTPQLIAGTPDRPPRRTR